MNEANSKLTNPQKLSVRKKSWLQFFHS